LPAIAKDKAGKAMAATVSDETCKSKKVHGLSTEKGSVIPRSFQVLLENPDLMKAVFAASLLSLGTVMSPGTTMVLTELKTREWGEHMASYSALVNAVNGVLGMAFSGLVGRLGDRVDRKLAMVLVGVLGFMPNWSLLVLGQDRLGLEVFSILQVFSGIACISATGCPTCYALVSDVMPCQDREVAFGSCFAAIVSVSVIGNCFAYLLQSQISDEHMANNAVLWFVAGTNVLYFGFVAWVRLPPLPSVSMDSRASESGMDQMRDAEIRAEMVSHSDAAVAPLEEETRIETRQKAQTEASSHDREVQELPISRRSQEDFGDSDGQSRWDAILGPLTLVSQHAPLRILCIVASLVSFPENTLMDVSSQYFLSIFDLVGTNDSKEQANVALLGTWPGIALLAPAFYIAGLLGKKLGSAAVLQLLLPIGAVLLLLPLILNLAPHLWLEAIVGSGIPLAMVVFAPLQTLITEVAPAGRIGEAMGAVGASKQIAMLFSNLLVTFVTPVLLESGLENPLWIYYPFASICMLVALAFALRVSLPEQVSEAQQEQIANPVVLVRTGLPGTPASQADGIERITAVHDIV